MSAVLDVLHQMELQALAAVRIGSENPDLRDVVLNENLDLVILLDFYAQLYNIDSAFLELVREKALLKGRAIALSSQDRLAQMAVVSESQDPELAKF